MIAVTGDDGVADDADARQPVPATSRRSTPAMVATPRPRSSLRAARRAGGGLDAELVDHRRRQLPEHRRGGGAAEAVAASAGGSSIETRIVTCGSSAGKNPTKLA